MNRLKETMPSGLIVRCRASSIPHISMRNHPSVDYLYRPEHTSVEQQRSRLYYKKHLLCRWETKAFVRGRN
jgi:hypothetical protein